jgi:lysozyme family protein
MGFETVYNGHTKRTEGGYANSVKDKRGGETFRGISRLNHPDWDGWEIVDQIKQQLGLTTSSTYGKSSTWKSIDSATNRDYRLDAMVVDFYRQEFYKPYLKQEIPELFRDKIFDTAVNVGHGNAVKILQRALNCLVAKEYQLKVDGALGPKTLSCVANVPLNKLVSRFVSYQLGHYEAWLKGSGKQYWDQREAFYARARWLPSGL